MTSLELARRVLAGLVAGGLRDLVVAPGSRNAPLIYAAFEAEQRGDLRIHVRLDERSAGFTALGLAAGALLPDAAPALPAPGNVGFAARSAAGSAAASGTVAEPVEAAAADAPRPAAPVAVVTTSGTAVGNLHPAVMEAAAARLPLVVVSADRPPELHGVGANQTFDQRRMFGAAPVWEATVRPDLSPARAQALGTAAAEAALGVRSDQAGPVHLNVQLRDPLTPPSPWPPAAEPSAGRQQPARPRSGPRSLPPVTLTTEPRTVVVAGFGATDAARRLAEQAGWPLLAEPASGAWAGPNAVTAAALAVRVLGSAVERVVVYGRPVLFRPVLGLVAGGQAEVVVVHPTGGPWFDQGRRARVIAGRIDLDGPPADSRWLAAWLELGTAAWEAVSGQAELSGPQIAAAVAAAAGGGPLVVGASTPIRDLALTPAPAAIQPVAAMRGLGGIDGTIGFAGGVNLATGRGVHLLLGDLSLLHDSGSLAVGNLEKRPDLRIVVVNNGGGAIFENLEVASPDLAPAYERFFATPHSVDLEALSAAHRLGYRRATTLAELKEALAGPIEGLSLVEVVSSRASRRGFEDRIVELSRKATHLHRQFA